MYSLDFINGLVNARVGSKRVKGAMYKNKEYIFTTFRLPETADILSGKKIRLDLSSKAIMKKTTQCFHNYDYLTSSGEYTFWEQNIYDIESEKNDIYRFTTSLGIYKKNDGTLYETLYKCVTRVFVNWLDQNNNEILSVDEQVKKTEFTLPNDFGWVLAYKGSQQKRNGLDINLDIQVDNFEIEKKPYHLENLTKNDDLKSQYVLVSSFPTNIQNILYPNGPDENIRYTLFEESNPENFLYQSIYACCYKPYLGRDPETYLPIYADYYCMDILFNKNDETFSICYGEFDKDFIDFNKSVIIGIDGGVSLKLSSLNTLSPLYQYIKKVIWD